MSIVKSASNLVGQVESLAATAVGSVNTLKNSVEGVLGKVGVTAKTNQTAKAASGGTVDDNSWLKGSFLVSDKDLGGHGYENWIRRNRYSTSADLKFHSTAPGMNIALNPKPQFTRYCDPRNPGKLKGRQKVTVTTTGHPFGLGMGDYYSVAYDDNAHRIFLRFGSPQYMSMLVWIGKAFDVHKAALAGRGMITSTLLSVIDITTKFMAVFVSPYLFLGKILFNSISQSGKFISVKDNMYSYWATVENILNSIVVRRTMVPFFESDGSGDILDTAVSAVGGVTARSDNTIDQQKSVTASYVRGLNELIPDCIDPQTGRISVFSIALRGQAAFNRMLAADIDKAASYDIGSDFTNYPLTGEPTHDSYFTNKEGKPTFFIKNFFKRAYDLMVGEEGDGSTTPPKVIGYNPTYTQKNGEPVDTTKPIPPDAVLPAGVDPNDEDVVSAYNLQENTRAKNESMLGYSEFLLAELSEGMAFLVLNVESTGSVGESFSNSAAANPIETVFNSISAKSRSMMNNLKSLTNVPVLSDVVGVATDAAAITISNLTFGLANPLLALAYGANISLPKSWESSAASLPKASYKIKLISPYGNAYSQLFNMYMPLAAIMAGALPKSTGLDSYTAPFMCQLYDRGRVNVPLGMIDSFSITRGTSNLAFTRAGQPNAIDVDFSVLDLNEIIAVDITSSSHLARVVDLFDSSTADTPFTNYINTLVGVDAYSQFYAVPSLRLKMAERVMSAKAIFNPDPASVAAFTTEAMSYVGVSQLGKLFLGNNSSLLSEQGRR